RPPFSQCSKYELPSSAEVYVHGIGRTGRAGRGGAAMTILDPREQRLLRSIEQHTKAKVTVASVPSTADLLGKRLERTRAAVLEALRTDNIGQVKGGLRALAG